MRTSERGLELIKEHEGFRAQRYICPGGKPTIGYGHVILPTEPHLNTAVLTEAEATEILARDVEIAERGVNRHVTVELNQNQFDALVSFTFNLGSGNLGRSTLLRLLNEEDYNGAASQFDRWVYAMGEDGVRRKLPGLISRRADERDLFLEPYVKPIMESRTVWGSATAATAVVAVEAADWASTAVPALTPLASSPLTKTLLFALALGGAALALYARIDDRNKRRR